MISKNELSIIIQGPLNEASLSNINNYKKYSSNIIISCWQTDDICTIQDSEITVLRNKLPDLERVKKHYADQSANHYYQLYSTHRGLALCDTSYTLKVRSDEYYSNIAPLLTTLNQNINDVVTVDWVNTKVLSDHILLASTNLLRKSFSYLVYEYLKDEVPTYMLRDSLAPSIEEIIAQTLINFSETNLTFPVVKVDDLGSIRCVWNHRNIVYTK